MTCVLEPNAQVWAFWQLASALERGALAPVSSSLAAPELARDGAPETDESRVFSLGLHAYALFAPEYLLEPAVQELATLGVELPRLDRVSRAPAAIADLVDQLVMESPWARLDIRLVRFELVFALAASSKLVDDATLVRMLNELTPGTRRQLDLWASAWAEAATARADLHRALGECLEAWLTNAGQHAQAQVVLCELAARGLLDVAPPECLERLPRAAGEDLATALVDWLCAEPAMGPLQTTYLRRALAFLRAPESADLRWELVRRLMRATGNEYDTQSYERVCAAFAREPTSLMEAQRLSVLTSGLDLPCAERSAVYLAERAAPTGLVRQLAEYRATRRRHLLVAAASGVIAVIFSVWFG